MNALTEGDCRRALGQESPDRPYTMARGFRNAAWAGDTPERLPHCIHLPAAYHRSRLKETRQRRT